MTPSRPSAASTDVASTDAASNDVASTAAASVAAASTDAPPVAARPRTTRKTTPARWTDGVEGEPHPQASDPSRDVAPLGAHVSIAGGTPEAARRAREIGASAVQVFTKQANRWAEREVDAAEAAAWRAAFAGGAVRWACAHDSYLINLASPDAALRSRSIASLCAELRRCHALGLDALVSHPGNYMDDRASGLARNADGIVEALESTVGPTRLLMELTAGQGTVLGATFEEMAALLARLPAGIAGRVGVCLDTAHVWAAGYDLRGAYDELWDRFDATIGLARLGCLHLNDSKAALGSHLDRHELIGEGTIGAEVFRRLMTDPRLAAVPRIIETPKGDVPAASDARMLRLLRGFADGALEAP
jgi:deoxyribonuclease-4